MDEILFWAMIATVGYAYAGYGALIALAGAIVRFFGPLRKTEKDKFEPEVTLIIAFYNEEDFIEKKIQNTLSLNYPSGKIKSIWIDDGSRCACERIFARHPEITLIRQAERRGKSAAINRGMQAAETEIVVFSDANAMLAPESLRELVYGFRDPEVGCVAGEKRFRGNTVDNAAGRGESAYWRYESSIKKMEARIGSTISATGEFFAVRRRLFTPVPEDSLTEDFVISTRIAMRGYKIDYCPQAYAVETASANAREEWKRKTRIAAGALQSLIRNPGMLNPFKRPLFSFQYASHKFLRTFFVPFFVAALVPLNWLIVERTGSFFGACAFVLYLQFAFHAAAVIGFMLEKCGRSFPVFSLPFYFDMTNLACIVGFYNYFTGKQSVKWKKAKRVPDSH